MGEASKIEWCAAGAGRRARLFVASMADLFEDHPDLAGWRAEALDLLATLRHTDVQLLTKRPENILRMVPPEWLDAWPAHVWIGTTVEDQQRADERVPHLLRVPARVRFVSYEPALGPVDFAYTCFTGADSFGTMPGIHWIIAGGESGPRARPAHPDWFRSVRDQCAQAGVPFLFKQWGEWAQSSDVEANGADWLGMYEPDPRDGGAPRHSWPDSEIRATLRRLGKSDVAGEIGGDTVVLRVGKRAAGRMLDGRLHDEYPEVSRG